MSYNVTVERQTLLTCEPYMTTLAFMQKHEDAKKKFGDSLPADYVASTDGKTIWYGPKFEALDRAGRNYIFVHELMHGIFMHPKRTMLLKLRYGYVYPSLANYAADAIINEAINANPMMHRGLFDMPREFPGVLMKSIHEAIGEVVKKTGETPPDDYDPKALHGQQMEVIYAWLMWAKNTMDQWRKKNNPNCSACKQPKPKPGQKPKQGQKGAGKDKGDKQDGQGQSKQDNQQNGDQQDNQSGNGAEQPGDEDGKQQQPGDESNQGQPGDKPEQDDQAEGQEGNDGEDNSQDGNGQPGDNANDNADGERCGNQGSKPCRECGQDVPPQGAGAGAGGAGGQGQGSPGEGNGQGEEQQQPDDLTAIERMAQEPAWDLEQGLEELREALERGETPSSIIDKLNRDIQEARAKIQQIVQGAKLAGVGQGSMLVQLENDLPKAVVPWNRKLRKLITRDLGTKMDDSYTRYGSPTKSAVAMRMRNVPFTPGTTIFTERPRVLVILDVSGSHIAALNQCMAEIWAIALMKGAAVDVITFDDGVQQKFEIRNKTDLRQVLKEGLRGAGGTCLNGVFEDVSKMRTPYRACIIMTDGYLSPPTNNKNKVSIVWMITPGGTAKGLEESGEIIYLPDYMNESAGQQEKKAA